MGKDNGTFGGRGKKKDSEAFSKLNETKSQVKVYQGSLVTGTVDHCCCCSGGSELILKCQDPPCSLLFCGMGADMNKDPVSIPPTHHEHRALESSLTAQLGDDPLSNGLGWGQPVIKWPQV